MRLLPPDQATPEPPASEPSGHPATGRPRVARALLASVAACLAVAVPLVVGFLSANAMTPFATSWGAYSGRINVAEGARIFSTRCAGCHSLTPGSTVGAGPNLSAIGRDAAKRRSGMSAARYLLESIVAPNAFLAPGSGSAMPRKIAESLAPSEIRSLVEFLAGREAVADLAEIEALEIVKPERPDEPERRFDVAQIEAGERLYAGKAGCAACHEIERAPSVRLLTAPNLDVASEQDLAYLHQSIVDPSAKIAPSYITWEVALADGRILTGQLLRRSASEIALLTTDDLGRTAVLAIPLSDVEIGDDGRPMIRETGVSRMPKGFGETLSREEIDALIAFIKSLG